MTVVLYFPRSSAMASCNLSSCRKATFGRSIVHCICSGLLLYLGVLGKVLQQVFKTGDGSF